jgi:hypothetical protein
MENDTSNNYSIVACVLVEAVTFLPSRSLATIVVYTYRYKDWWEIFTKYAVEMGLNAVIQTVPRMRKRPFKGTLGATFLRDYRALRR